MSAILIQTIAFNGTNPYGDFLANDLVECFYDPSSDPSPTDLSSGITVKKNGSPITSGADIHIGSVSGPSPATVSQSGFGNICNAGYNIGFLRVDVAPSFPYLLKFPLQDHTDCSVNPSVCDLAFSPDITLDYPSSPSSNDGSITVSAVSSNAIKYRIGSDFDYNDGTGQTSAVFSSLIPGSYRIYARDSINCGANILISLPYQNSYSTIYTVNYLNIRGHRTKIDITKRNYVGSSSDMVCGDSPLQISLRGETNLDKFNPIISTQATIQLVAVSNGQYRDLFTNDPKQYQVNIYKDTSGGTSYTLIYTGFIIPQIYQESFTIAPYNVQVKASDNLSDLANYSFFRDDGNKFFGQIKSISLISTVLRKTGLDLSIRSGVNLFADAMSKSPTDDPLDQAYVDVDSYYIAEGIPTFASVLAKILKPMRIVLMQSFGMWYLVRPEECCASFAYRDFDHQGSYLSNGSFDPVVNIDNASASNRLVWKDQDQNMEIRPGIGKLRIKYHLGYKENILRNGDFSLITTWDNGYQYKINLYGFQILSPYPMASGYEVIDSNDVNNVALVITGQASLMSQPLGYVQSSDYLMAMGVNNSLKISANIKIQSGVNYSIAVDGAGNLVVIPNKTSFYYQKVRLRVYYGGKYLLNDGTWTNIPSDIVFYSTQWDQYVDFNISANWPDATFSTEKKFNVRCYHSWANDVDFTNIAFMRGKVTNSSVAISGSSNRGSYNASSGLFPSTGGSGGGGSLQAGDYWTVGTAGTIQDIFCAVGTKLRVVYGPPGQAMENWLIGDITLSEGTKTELRDFTATGSNNIFYYELKKNTSAESVPNIVRPNDYNASTNPYQWILAFTGSDFDQRPYISTYINSLKVQFLDNGQKPFDTIISDISGESNNPVSIEDDVYHGSLESVVTSISASALVTNLKYPSESMSLQLSDQYPNNRTIFQNIVTVPITQTVLSGNLIYTGFFRDASGNGFDKWSRPSVSDSLALHRVWLSTTIFQYQRSWKKITGSLDGDIYAACISTFKEKTDGDVFFRASSLTLDDKMNSYNGEFLEMVTDINSSGGGSSGGGVSSAFSSGFSSGFN